MNWILDADVKGFFDAMDHSWLIKFLEHRIGDSRVLRLIRKWLRAGVIEEGKRLQGKMGTPQGAVISPLLSNVYLHYVLDLWIEWWRKHRSHGDVVIVRYADDFVIGFESLELHEGKTRLIEFGRYAADRRSGRGGGTPETFDFLGFTHGCGKTRKDGRFIVRRHSVAKRMRATLQAIKAQLRKRRHRPLDETARWLRRVVQGWLNYHAVPGNSNRICRFVDEVARLWLRAIRRRSQRGRCWTWERLRRLVRKHLPRPRITHPYPEQRFRARLKVGAV